MPLTDLQIKNFRPELGKPVRRYDQHGLYLEVSATVRTYWRWKYRYAGNEKRLALGVYPEISLIEVEGCIRSIGIEYERSAKSVTRYDAIREALDNDKTTDLVLYLVASEDLLYLVAMELRSARKRIAFALSDAFRRSLLETRTLTNTASSEIMPFRELLNLKHPSSPSGNGTNPFGSSLPSYFRRSAVRFTLLGPSLPRFCPKSAPPKSCMLRSLRSDYPPVDKLFCEVSVRVKWSG